MNKLKDIETKRAEITAELKSLNDRMETEGATPGLVERAANLVKASSRLAEDWNSTMLDLYNAGGLHSEPGDGAAPITSYKGGHSGRTTSPLAEAIVGAGFSLKSNPSVEFKAPTWPAATDWDRAAPVLVPRGMDRRFLWPALQVERLRMGVSSIQDFKQTARTLTGTVKRAIDASTDKATLDTTVTLVNEQLSQFAVVIENIPNAILESVPAFDAFMQSEGEFQVMKAIDDHVLAQIVAAAPPFGTTGTTLIDKTRNGIATMRGTGTNPDVAVLNPTDAASLDLSADAGGYVFPTATTGTSSPLWGLKVVERIGAGTEPPYLIDTNTLGVLYLGSMRFDADPFTGFKKNLTTLRIEVNALFHVRNAEGARRIAAT